MRPTRLSQLKGWGKGQPRRSPHITGLVLLSWLPTAIEPHAAIAIQAGGVEIPSVEGSIVGQPFKELNLPEAPLELVGIEVTQAIQGMNAADPIDHATNNTVPLIAGKRTVVRAYFDVISLLPTSPRPNIRISKWIQGKLEVSRNNKHVATINSEAPAFIDPADNGVLSRKRKDLRKSLYFYLPPELTSPGELTLKIGNTITDGVLTWRCTRCNKEVRVPFVNSAPLKIKLIKWREDQPPEGLPVIDFDEHIAYIKSWLLRAFPISPDNFHMILEIGPRNFAGGTITDCDRVAIQTRAARNGELESIDKTLRYVGLFINRTGGNELHGCTYIRIDDENKGQSRPDNPVAVPLGKPGDWRHQMGWDPDKTYADGYTGHELGHTFGLAHLPFGVDCDPVTGSGCPDEPYDPAFADGLISGPDERYVGFDVGDSIESCTKKNIFFYGRPSFLIQCGVADLPAQVLHGDKWHDVMTYSHFWWLSARQGSDSNGSNYAGRSYDWIRQKLWEESLPPPASGMIDGSVVTDVASATGKQGIRSTLLSASSVAHATPLNITDNHARSTPVRNDNEAGKRGLLKLLLSVNLTKDHWRIEAARRLEVSQDNGLPSEGSSFITLFERDGSPVGRPIPVIVMRNADTQRGSDQILLLDTTVPLPVDADKLLELDKWEIVIPRHIISKALHLDESDVHDFVITSHISHEPPVIAAIQAHRTADSHANLFVGLAANAFFKANDSLVTAKDEATKAAAREDLSRATQRFRSVLTDKQQYLESPITLAWVTSDNDTPSDNLRYTVRIRSKKENTWHTVGVGYTKTTLILSNDHIINMGIAMPTEVEVSVTATDGFNESTPQLFHFVVRPPSREAVGEGG